VVIDVQVLVWRGRILSSDRNRGRADRVVDEDRADHDPGDHADRRQAESHLDEVPGPVLSEYGAQARERAMAAGEGELDEGAASVTETEAGSEYRQHHEARDSELTGRHDAGKDHV
jgi:hypothetical protein